MCALEREYEKVTSVAVSPGGVKVHASPSTTCTFCQPFAATLCRACAGTTPHPQFQLRNSSSICLASNVLSRMLVQHRQYLFTQAGAQVHHEYGFEGLQWQELQHHLDIGLRSGVKFVRAAAADRFAISQISLVFLHVL